MEKHKLVYGGMSQDLSPNNQDQKFYYDAQNIEIFADDDSTGFAVTTSKGNTLRWQVPSIQNIGGQFRVTLNGALRSTVSHNSLTSPDANNPSIVGHCNLRDKIVVFSTADDEYTQIWVLTITNSIITEELVYHNKLDITRTNPIRRAIGRYENASTQKVYFTDNNNFLRFINVADSNTINIEPGLIDIIPDVTLSQPSVTATTSGSFTTGKVAYAYTLVDKKGGVSTISPLSPLYNINNGFRGGELEESLGIGFEITIPNVDTNFEIIRIYRIKYTSENQEPAVTLIAEQTIDNISTITIPDDGIINVASSSISEILLAAVTPFKSKDLAVKDNRLFAANITYENFDIGDWDARAYRFDTTPEALLQDNSLGDLTITSPNDTVPTDFDCINPTNYEEADLNYKNGAATQNTKYHKYIYQSDGVTLGAEGPNIKVTIGTSTELLEDDFTEPSNKKVYSTFGKAAPTLTYKRDEIYRFGIIFFNDKGQRSFVKWIGDIRMPNQNNATIGEISSYSGSKSYRHNITVSFYLKTVPAGAVGYQIVRAERTNDDKTILGQGVIGTYLGTNDPAHSAVLDYIQRTHHSASGTSSFNKYALADTQNVETEINGLTGYVYNQATSILSFHSPEISMDSTFQGHSDSYFTIVGGMGTSNTFTIADGSRFSADADADFTEDDTYELQNSFPTSIFNSSTYTHYTYIQKGVDLISTNIVYVPILGTTGIVENAQFSASKLAVDNGTGQPEVSTAGRYRTANHDAYVRAGKHLVAHIGFYNNGDGIEDCIYYDGSNYAFPKNTVNRFIIADYKRPLSNQYGGNSYEAIQRTQYIPASNYTPITTLTALANRGDTYIQNYVYNRGSWESGRTDSTADYGSISVRVICPIETSYNLDMRADTNNSYNELKDAETVIEDYFNYSNVYSQENNSVTYTPEPFNFVVNDEFDSRVLHSDVKINGETVDNWARFTSNSYLDVENTYGAITSLNEFNDQLYFFQPEAVGVLSINPRPQVVSDGVVVQLGSGNVLDDFQYITTTSGSINQYGIVKTNTGLFYIDALNYKLNQITNQQNPISDINGMHSWFKANMNIGLVSQDNPYNRNGISCGFDVERSTVYFTLLQSSLSEDLNTVLVDNSYTIGYNTMLQTFSSFYSFTPSLYINNRNNLYTTNLNKVSLWEHDTGDPAEYYGTQERPYITMLANPQPDFTKVFEVLQFNSRTGASDDATRIPYSIQVYNDYQDSGEVVLTLGDNIVRKFREWRITLPRESGSMARIRSQYAYIKLDLGTEHLQLQNMVLSYITAPASFI